MTAAERLKKRFKGGVPHKADKKLNNSTQAFLLGGLRDVAKIRRRKSGRNETDPGTRKRGYDFF